jgi:murein DD-endopeptidase MepM/ murein hydrolase activator NlpD
MNKTKTIRIIGMLLFVCILVGVNSTPAYAHTAYSGYVSATSSSSNRYVYRTPNTNYSSIGSVWEENVTVFWKEGNYYYIEYTLSSGAVKRGYIAAAAMSNLSSDIPDSNPYTPQTTTMKAITGTLQILNAPNSTVSNGSIYNESAYPVTIIGEDGDWYYIQYATSTYNRGYVLKSKVNDPSGSDSSDLGTSTDTTTNPYAALGWVYFFEGNSPSYISNGYYPSSHTGIDVPNTAGTPIRAVATGEVVYCGEQDQNGYFLTLKCTSYAAKNGYFIVRSNHMLSEPLYQKGDVVTQGSIIGYVGATGLATGNHLHFDVSDGGSKYTCENPVDPMQFFPDITFTGSLYS